VQVSVTDAKAQLTELVRRAEAGEEVVLTRHGRPVAQLKPTAQARREWTEAERAERYRRLMEISARASKEATPGPDAAHVSDYLFDENGLPV
jgi:prevent-host-death family protein